MSHTKKFIYVFLIFNLFFIACQSVRNAVSHAAFDSAPANAIAASTPIKIDSPNIEKLLKSAIEQTKITKNYDPAYVVINYPNGDVPIETGVCSDVVIRAFRAAGVDLQREVHEDMTANFAAYPNKWNLPKPDANIDHRRVLNLQTFFTRRGKSLPIIKDERNYQPGDVVSWDLDGKGMTHIGLISNFYDEKTKRFLIIHNIGGGTTAEDALFNWKITGHFRYF